MTKVLVADDHPSMITALKSIFTVFTGIDPITFYEATSLKLLLI